MSGVSRAQQVVLPDTYFSPLPLETGDTNKGEFGNVEVIKGQTCDQTSKKGTVNCSSKFKKHTITVGPNDKIRIRGTFTNFDPIVEGEACNSTDEVDDNFLNSGGSTFIISVNNGGVGALCSLTNTDTGIGFTLVWTVSKDNPNVAVPVGGTATWSDSNHNTGTATADGTMTLLGTGVGDCGTWALDITFSNVSAASLGADKSEVNIQMDFGDEVSVPGTTSFGCLETLLDIEPSSFD